MTGLFFEGHAWGASHRPAFPRLVPRTLLFSVWWVWTFEFESLDLDQPTPTDLVQCIFPCTWVLLLLEDRNSTSFMVVSLELSIVPEHKEQALAKYLWNKCRAPSTAPLCGVALGFPLPVPVSARQQHVMARNRPGLMPEPSLCALTLSSISEFWGKVEKNSFFCRCQAKSPGQLVLKRPNLPEDFQGKVYKTRWGKGVMGCVTISWTFFWLVGGEVLGSQHHQLSGFNQYGV